jgi:hypothetical protein
LLLPSTIGRGVKLKDEEMQNEKKQDEKDFELATAGSQQAQDNSR